MKTIIEITTAISHLSEQELAELRTWFAEYDAERWDRQFEDDVREGRLDALADEALQEAREGRCREL